MLGQLRKLARCKYLYIGDAGEIGVGVFAARPFKSGDILIDDDDGDYYAHTYTRSQLRERNVDLLRHAFQIDHNSFVMANGIMDDFLNHSCHPNLGVKLKPSGYEVVAISDIARDEQLCYDYSTYMFGPEERFSCKCGRAGCRGEILEFSALPADLKARYRDLEIVAPALAKTGGHRQDKPVMDMALRRTIKE